MVRSAALCDCVCGILIGIKHSNPSGINATGNTMFYNNLNSTNAVAKSRWTHHYANIDFIYTKKDVTAKSECDVEAPSNLQCHNSASFDMLRYLIKYVTRHSSCITFWNNIMSNQNVIRTFELNVLWSTLNSEPFREINWILAYRGLILALISRYLAHILQINWVV